MFLLVPAYPGCPGSKAVKRSLLIVLYCVHDHIFGNTRPIFIKSFVYVTCGRGSVLLLPHNDALCTSGFMDDVIVAQAEDARRHCQADGLRLTRNVGLGT